MTPTTYRGLRVPNVPPEHIAEWKRDVDFLMNDQWSPSQREQGAQRVCGDDKLFLIHGSTEDLAGELAKLLAAEPVTLYTRALFAEIMRRNQAASTEHPYSPDPLDELVRG